MKSLSFCDLDQVITVEPGCYFIDALLTKTRDDPISSKFFNWQEVEKYKSFGGVRIESDVVRSGYAFWWLCGYSTTCIFAAAKQ